MGHSSAVGFLVFALCLLACLTASATFVISHGEKAAAYIVEVAKQEVEAAKTSMKEVFKKAERALSNANTLLERVKSFDTEVSKAESQAGQADLKVAEMTTNNKDAEVNVNKIKTMSKAASTFHRDGKEKLDNTIASLGQVIKEAQKVESECNKELLVIKNAAEDYIDTNDNVPDLKTQAGVLERNIANILTEMNGVQSTVDNMEKSLKEAELANSHLSVIVAVAKVDTMIKNAESVIEDTQNKKDEVNKIVEEMKTLKTRATAEAIDDINKLWKTAEDELTKAKGAVGKAKTEKEAMKQQKILTDAALTNVKAETENVIKARKEVEKAEACVTAVEKIVPQLQSALQTATTSVANAKDSKQKMEKNLAKATTKPSIQQSKELADGKPPVVDGTEPDQKDATVQPARKELPDQSNGSYDKLKDALSNGAQNVSTTALTGGKAPAPGANNDSAMTVSVPLLVALIASAVLQ